MKKQLFKKFLSVFLSTALVLTMAPLGFTAKADDDPAMLTPHNGGASTPYPTVAEAFDAANTDDIITLLQDTTETLRVNLNGKTVVLDGNNHTITGAGRSAALYITGSGTLILKNITLTGGAASGSNKAGDGIHADPSFTGTVAAWGNVTAKGAAATTITT